MRRSYPDKLRSSVLDAEGMAGIKGVSTSPVVLAGLFETGTDLTLRFPDVTASEVRSLAWEVSRGVYAGALPWLSLESTADRHAARVSCLHPCYRDTLTGAILLEVDVALKAVCGSAEGGVFCDIQDRDSFLDDVWARDWGPNGQRKADFEQFDSYKTTEDIVGGEAATEVRAWKQRWREVWDQDATGADVCARLDRLVLYDNRVADVESSWTAQVHSNDDAKEIARQGTELCASLLPLVPSPQPQLGTTLASCLALLRVIAALTSVFATARAAGLVPCNLEKIEPRITPRTPRWLPFEPAKDAESGALFLGGGVAIGASGALQLAHGPPPKCDAVPLCLKFRRSDADAPVDHHHHHRSRYALFLYEVWSLGLGDNYASIHTDAALDATIDPQAVADLLTELFPDGYCRRLRMSRASVAAFVDRPDVAELLDDKPLVVRERLELVNGDIYDGEWCFGRMHGSGKYTFASGARYEGRWHFGKMVGIGFFTTVDGQRHILTHRG